MRDVSYETKALRNRSPYILFYQGYSIILGNMSIFELNNAYHCGLSVVISDGCVTI